MQTAEPRNDTLSNSIATVAKRIGISKSGVYNLLAAGQLRSFKIGHRTLIAESELQRFVARSMGVAA
ncbi:helix-turn-helix domain-containing protein [Pseudoxanthomonas sp. LjRoot143]|uniref:helix-turn-helix domain-containing protein n=1 Tax=Pseudoxanthomonas sp. LjRoot143 TaxID=3342266 RepID=UPI003ECCA5E8